LRATPNVMDLEPECGLEVEVWCPIGRMALEPGTANSTPAGSWRSPSALPMAPKTLLPPSAEVVLGKKTWAHMFFQDNASRPLAEAPAGAGQWAGQGRGGGAYPHRAKGVAAGGGCRHGIGEVGGQLMLLACDRVQGDRGGWGGGEGAEQGRHGLPALAECSHHPGGGGKPHHGSMYLRGRSARTPWGGCRVGTPLRPGMGPQEHTDAWPGARPPGVQRRGLPLGMPAALRRGRVPGVRGTQGRCQRRASGGQGYRTPMLPSPSARAVRVLWRHHSGAGGRRGQQWQLVGHPPSHCPAGGAFRRRKTTTRGLRCIAPNP
jgi:hypothetical protein